MDISALDTYKIENNFHTINVNIDYLHPQGTAYLYIVFVCS